MLVAGPEVVEIMSQPSAEEKARATGHVDVAWDEHKLSLNAMYKDLGERVEQLEESVASLLKSLHRGQEQKSGPAPQGDLSLNVRSNVGVGQDARLNSEHNGQSSEPHCKTKDDTLLFDTQDQNIMYRSDSGLTLFGEAIIARTPTSA